VRERSIPLEKVPKFRAVRNVRPQVSGLRLCSRPHQRRPMFVAGAIDRQGNPSNDGATTMWT
jgi:hypothetical protein